MARDLKIVTVREMENLNLSRTFPTSLAGSISLPARLFCFAAIGRCGRGDREAISECDIFRPEALKNDRQPTGNRHEQQRSDPRKLV